MSAEGLEVFILAPTGRDGSLAGQLLHQAGLAHVVCADMAGLCAGLRRGAGCLLIAEEALSPAALVLLAEALDEQESWSDVPVVVFSSSNPTAAAARRLDNVLRAVGNAIFIERPVRAITLVAALKGALRARQRQYQVRGILEGKIRSEAQAQESVRFLQQLLGIVSHDLRNPISAVLISAESLLRRGPLSEKQERVIRRIMSAGQRANTMVLDLLDFARARLGREMPLQIVDCDLGQLTRQFVDELAAAHPDRHIQVDISGDVVGQCDQGRVAQVLQNLMGNALQYSSADSPVSVSLRAKDNDTLVLSVQNFGSAISVEQQDRIFEPMERGNGEEAITPQGNSRSVGLGLYIVKQIVTAHGGTTTLTSNAAHGTTFEVCLPRRVVRNDHAKVSF